MQAAVVGPHYPHNNCPHLAQKAGYPLQYTTNGSIHAAIPHANGGQLSASNAEVWNSWRSIHKGIQWLTRADALKNKSSFDIEKYSWLIKFTPRATQR